MLREKLYEGLKNCPYFAIFQENFFGWKKLVLRKCSKDLLLLFRKN